MTVGCRMALLRVVVEDALTRSVGETRSGLLSARWRLARHSRPQAAKRRKIEDDDYLPQSVLQFLGVEEEQQARPGDLQRPQGLQPSYSHREGLPVSGDDQSVKLEF